jgi:hypothetical protein
MKKTVIIVTPSYPPAVSGAASYFYSLTEQLKDRVRFIILTTTFGERDEEVDDVLIYRFVPNVIKSNILFRALLLPFFTFVCLSIWPLNTGPR